MGIQNPFSKKDLKKFNEMLLRHLEDALEIMAKTRCPYFKIDGFGAIYMDEKYIKRYGVNINKDDIDKCISDYERLFNPKRNKELTNLLTAIASDVSYIKRQIDEVPMEIEEPKKPKTPIKVGMTLEDALRADAKKEKIEDEEEDEDELEPNPNITKEEAIDTVQKGKRAKSFDKDEVERREARLQLNKTYKKEKI